MNFEDYAQYIVQKHRLAIALAVIKSKPNDTTIERHIDNIKDKIKENNMDSNVDVSICDEDFNISDDIANDDHNQHNQSHDSETILKDFNTCNLENEGRRKNDANSLLNVMTELSNIEDNSVNEILINTQSNRTQSTFFDKSQKDQSTSNTITNNIPDDIITFCESLNSQLTTDCRNSNTTHDPSNINGHNETFCESHEVAENIKFNDNANELSKENSSRNKNFDSQQTELYTLYGFKNNTHVSQSQEKVVISDKYLLNRSKTGTISTENIQKSKENTVNNNVKTSKSQYNNQDFKNFGVSNMNSQEENAKKHKNLEHDNNDESKRVKTVTDKEKTVDTEFEIFSRSTNYQNNINSFDIDFGGNNNETFSQEENLTQNSTFRNINSNNNTQDAQNVIINISDERNEIESLEFSQSFQNDVNTQTEFEETIDIFKSLESDLYAIKSNEKKILSNNSSQSQNVTNLKTKEIVCVNERTKEVISKDNRTKECISNDNTQFDKLIPDDFSDDATETNVEMVSFKTLEELNRVKCYLNRRERRISEGNTSNSGFRCSQSRSFYKSGSQCSENQINASAHCLFNFITTNQLSDKTKQIADEISKILGKLVDKLHEEEIYPNFLEELLKTVNGLLNDVYDSKNEKINVLLKKEDLIDRILLLNRSTHIIKYTIEKITITLEKTFCDISEDIFELKDIAKAENIAYIFHILETILKRNKNYSSQISIQTTQDNDNRLLKKSSLTEIWRKKWNFAKSEVSEGSSNKKCVLTKCSEVLNKIIVQAMNGYSLVAFAALQCFNLLQN